MSFRFFDDSNETNQMVRSSFNEPAKRARRVIAPGDGKAEPGVMDINFREPAKRATDG